jgi:hypothetical protein
VPAYVYALMLHGLIGGLDVFVNHEWLARLPAQPHAGREEAMHSAREFCFFALFLSLAWFEWHGAAVWWIAALFLAEVGVSAADVLVEGEIRVLPRAERVLHLFLFMNLGTLLVLVGQAGIDWHALPSGLVRANHGWASWVLSVMALGSLVWTVRDGLSAWRSRSRTLGRRAPAQKL